MDNEEDLDELREELDEYPLPEDKKSDYPKPEDKKSVSYKNVDITIKFGKESKTVEGDEERVLFVDGGVDFDEMLYDDKTEKLRIPIVLAKEMIYHYDTYDAFRPKEELKQVAGFLKGVPVTRGHPEAKMVTDREEVLGWAIEAEFEDDELRAVLEIADKDLINDIRTKKLQGVSPGHFSKLDRTSSGEYDGGHYDLTQRDIFVDHIAIVERGRCNIEDGCGIMMDTKLDETKTKEGDEEVMEEKAVASKVNVAIVAAESIEKKAEEEKAVLKEIEEIEDVPSAVISKVKKAIVIAEKIGEEAKDKLKGKLETIKEAVGEGEEKMANGDEAGGEGQKHPLGEKSPHNHSITTDGIDETAMKQLKEERDALKVELDAIVEEEKEKLVDELVTLQDVKPKEELKDMSLDGLKSDLKLVKELRESKFSTDGHGDSGDSKEAIKSAYKSVGTKGGRK